MTDNTQLPGTGTGTADIKVATDKVTHSGDADVDVQLVRVVQVTGAEGSKTVVDSPQNGTTSQVNDTASSTQLLAADTARKGFRLWNNSTSALYIKYGTTASLTDCTAEILAGAFYSENNYGGRVDGIWSVDGSGAARITALT